LQGFGFCISMACFLFSMACFLIFQIKTQMNTDNHQNFIHIELNVETVAIGGHYVFTREVRLPFDGREILYMAGYALFDTSCCGSGGCGYALIPGFIQKWKNKINTDGRPISGIEPVNDPAMQKQIERLVKTIEAVPQVLFL